MFLPDKNYNKFINYKQMKMKKHYPVNLAKLFYS